MDEEKVKQLVTSIGMGLDALYVLVNCGNEWNVAAIREALDATREAHRELKAEVK